MKLLPLILAAAMVAPLANAKGFKPNPFNATARRVWRKRTRPACRLGLPVTTAAVSCRRAIISM